MQFIFAYFHLDQLPATFTYYLHGRQGHWFCVFAAPSRGQSSDHTQASNSHTEGQSSSAAIIISCSSVINQFYFFTSIIDIDLQLSLSDRDCAWVKSAFRVWFLLSVQIQFTCVLYSDFYILIKFYLDLKKDVFWIESICPWFLI